MCGSCGPSVTTTSRCKSATIRSQCDSDTRTGTTTKRISLKSHSLSCRMYSLRLASMWAGTVCFSIFGMNVDSKINVELLAAEEANELWYAIRRSNIALVTGPLPFSKLRRSVSRTGHSDTVSGIMYGKNPDPLRYTITRAGTTIPPASTSEGHTNPNTFVPTPAQISTRILLTLRSLSSTRTASLVLSLAFRLKNLTSAQRASMRSTTCWLTSKLSCSITSDASICWNVLSDMNKRQR